MQHGLYNTQQAFNFPLYSGNISLGRSIGTATYFSRTAAGLSQSLYRRKRLQAASVTINLQFSRAFTNDLDGAAYACERLCGVVGELYWIGEYIGRYCVESVGISPVIDGDGIAALGVSLALKEGRVPSQFKEISIKTMERT